jgi:hypothetical protein
MLLTVLGIQLLDPCVYMCYRRAVPRHEAEEATGYSDSKGLNGTAYS